MTPPDRPGADGQVGIDLGPALTELRRHADDRWVSIANDVLSTVLSASRRSLPVAGVTAVGARFHVSEQVLIQRLRAHLDGALVGAAVSQIEFRADADRVLDDLVVELVAQYAHDLLPIADHARLLVEEVLDRDLGVVPTRVEVDGTHIHFGGVTIGDPHLSDPADE